MKQKFLYGFMTFAMSFASISHANFIFYSSTNSCNTILGEWNGEGTATDSKLIKCHYKGSGTITAVETADKYKLNVTVSKKNPKFFCPGPEHVTSTFNVECINGEVFVMTDYGKLNGTFTETQGSATGTLRFPGNVMIAVNLKFNKKSS